MLKKIKTITKKTSQNTVYFAKKNFRKNPGGEMLLLNPQDRGWSVVITMSKRNQLSWRWRQIRYVFGATCLTEDAKHYGLCSPIKFLTHQKNF